MVPAYSFVVRYAYHMERIKRLEAEKIIGKRKDKYIFLKDCIFNSPSMAVSIILQRSSNGWIDRKDKNGCALDEIKRKQE